MTWVEGEKSGHAFFLFFFSFHFFSFLFFSFLSFRNRSRCFENTITETCARYCIHKESRNHDRTSKIGWRLVWLDSWLSKGLDEWKIVVPPPPPRRREEIFFYFERVWDWLWWTPKPPIDLFSRYWELFPLGVKRPWCEAYHPLLSSARIQNAWSYTIAPPCNFVLKLNITVSSLASLDAKFLHGLLHRDLGSVYQT